jgi:hypothetical protein
MRRLRNMSARRLDPKMRRYSYWQTPQLEHPPFAHHKHAGRVPSVVRPVF